MPLPSGARIGPYEIVGQLGAGGMGEVYRARDSRLDRDVAIKVLRDDVTGDRDRLQRFTQEAKAASALNHPHIVTVHDIGRLRAEGASASAEALADRRSLGEGWSASQGTDGDVVYMVMELVTGRSLADVTPADGFSVPDVLRIGSQIADACAAAHARQIVHRDLKPANVMLQDDGRVKVLDFGLAKFIEMDQAGEGRSVTQTAAGTILGTVAYMSPEQAEGKPVDARTDIFSLGALLYEISTGQRAFPGASQASVFAAVLKEDPRPPEEVRPDLPAEFGRLIMRCLRKDPARRVQSMADLRAAIDDLKDELPGLKTRPPSGATEPPVQRKRPGAIIAIAAAVVLVLGAAAYWTLLTCCSSAEAVTVPLAPQPLTTYSGSEYAGGFSPDGRHIVFMWNGESQDNQDIYVKDIGPGAPLRLTTDPAPDEFAAWSPDGKLIAFTRELSPARIALLVISPQGGAERKLGEFHPRVAIVPYIALDWTDDSRFVLLASGRQPGEPSNIQRVAVETGDVQTVMAVAPVDDGYFSMDVSPDGRKLATTRDRGGIDAIEIFDISRDGELSNSKVFGDVTNAIDVRWMPNSHDVIYRRAVNNPGPLYHLSVDTGAITPLVWVGPGASSPAISASAHRLLFTRSIRDTNIWRVTIGTGPRPILDKVAESSFREVAPHYSPDGRRMAFHSNRGGSVQIWVADADGSKARQVTHFDEMATTGTPRWSSDSTQLVFDSNAGNGYHLHLLNPDGGEPRALTSGTSRNFTGWWSPDGRWIYYASDRSGRLEIWRIPPGGGSAEQVTRAGAEAPSLSPDGRWLYFTRKEGVDGLWRMPVAGGAETRVIDSLFRYNYFATSKGVYYATRPNTAGLGASVRYFDFATSKTTDITAIDATVDLGLTVSPDGKYLLFTKIDYLGADLMVVENFR